MKLRINSIIALFSVAFSLQAFSQQPIQVEITGNIFNTAPDSVKIAQYFGNKYVDFLKTKMDKNGNYKLSGQLPTKDYYVLRIGSQHINIILKEGSKLRINADAKNLTAFHTITGSDESVALNEFIVQLQAFNQKRDTAAKMIQRYPEQQAAINQSFQNEYMQFTSFRQQFVSRNPNSPALLPVISTLDLDKDFAQYEAIVNQLDASFSGSPNVEGIKLQFQQNKLQKEALNFLAPGKVAPNFTQNDVNGNPIELASLKGKVVLLDFWASWCGPCRKENPNVVKLYAKYKDAGFTVLSVSLDKDKAAWLAAIDKDKLVWPYHVSDLKYWSNEVAKQYQVSSIPFTALLDREGKIINTKLRGEDLERTLVSIFGF